MTIETLTQLSDPQQCRTIVLKIGSSLLVDRKGNPRAQWLAGLVEEIAEFRARGQSVVVVSSGAIALGAARLGFDKGGRANLADAQAAASVGQIALSGLWSELLETKGLFAAQMLVTLGDLEGRKRYLNASSTLSRLLEAGVVPVVNENDSVATREIRFGDNDRLAARIGMAAKADAVVLLSDINGLMDRNPKEPDAKLVKTVRGVSDEIREMAGSGSMSGLGTGGMTSKIKAAEIAERAGISLAIINGKQERPIAFALRHDRGTVFVPTRQDGARRAWLGGLMAPAGTLTVDKGCVSALMDGGSLLAAGITEVEGDFRRGDLVSICDASGHAIAQGLCEYSALHCRKIIGKRRRDQAKLLGYAPRTAVVHRDHMVML